MDASSARWQRLTSAWPHHRKRRFLGFGLRLLLGPLNSTLRECLYALEQCRCEPGPDLRLLIAQQDAAREAVNNLNWWGHDADSLCYHQAMCLCHACLPDVDLAAAKCLEHLDGWRDAGLLLQLLEKQR